MANFNLKIESVPMHSPEGAVIQTQVWNINNIHDVREQIIHQRKIHQKKSKWFKIYQNDRLIFDSKLIHSTK